MIFVPFSDGHPAGSPEDVLTGFVNASGEAQGRPVGVAVDRVGALLVADDVGNIVWRVQPETAGSAPRVEMTRKGLASHHCRTCYLR